MKNKKLTAAIITAITSSIQAKETKAPGKNNKKGKFQ
jgi:hypothetical protein